MYPFGLSFVWPWLCSISTFESIICFLCSILIFFFHSLQYFTFHILKACTLPSFTRTISTCQSILAIDNNSSDRCDSFCKLYCFDRNHISKIFLWHFPLFLSKVLCRLYVATFFLPCGSDFLKCCVHASPCNILFQTPQSVYARHAFRHLICRCIQEYNFL